MNPATTTREDLADSNLVPAPWNELFNNPEWLVHRIVVRSTYAMVAIVLFAHALCWYWRPWLMR